MVLPGLLLLALGVGAYLVYQSHARPDAPEPASPYALRTFSRQVDSLDALLAMPPERLRDVNIAEMNLLCATGLRGAENLDIDACLAKVDEWTAKVKAETERHLYRVTDPRYAEHYHHSEKYLRAEFLLQVLQEDCGVRYNMERVKSISFGQSKDLFIHGLVADPNGGTCASMPVLYVAVGRRLGYPLSLVKTKAHFFVRWKDETDRFNIEGTNGFSSMPDDYYKTWPMASTDKEVKANRYLVSLTPADELAEFMAARGHCLVENRRAKEGYAAYSVAIRLAPNDPAYRAWRHEAVLALRPAPSGRAVFTPPRVGANTAGPAVPLVPGPVVPGPIQPVVPSPWSGQPNRPPAAPTGPHPPRP